MSLDELEAAAAAAVQAGDDTHRVEVSLRREVSTKVTARDGSVDAYVRGDQTVATVTVTRDGRQAQVTTRGDAPALEAAVRTALHCLDDAGSAAPVSAPPHDAALRSTHTRVDPTLDALTAADRRERAISVERAASGSDPRVAGVYTAGWEDRLLQSVYADSSGRLLTSAANTGFAFAYVIAADEQQSQVALARHGGLDVDAAAVGDRARRYATRLLGATTPSAGRTSLVLDPEVTADLLHFLGTTLTGRAATSGSSPFAGHLDEAVAAGRLRLREDPRDAAAPEWCAFDDEGTPTRPVDLITQGALTALLHDRRSAAEAGCSSTGSAVRTETSFGASPRGLHFAPTAGSAADVLAGSDGGVYIQAVTGLHSGFDAVTGDLSFGATGLRIRGGELAEPLQGLVISSDVLRLLQSIRAVADDRQWVEHTAGATVAIDDVMVGAA